MLYGGLLHHSRAALTTRPWGLSLDVFLNNSLLKLNCFNYNSKNAAKNYYFSLNSVLEYGSAELASQQ